MAEKKALAPLYTSDELTKISGVLNADQMGFVLKKTPKEHTFERPAKGGGKWRYVTGAYVKKTLNVLFGWDWDFKVLAFDVNNQAKQCIVHGRLTGRAKGKEIIKEQFGRSDIAYKNIPDLDENGKKQYWEDRGTQKLLTKKSDEPLDLGNDLKAASTDALKKCSNELGLFSDIYSPDEYKEIRVVSEEKTQSKDYWRKLIGEQIDLCQDEGVREAMRRDAIELDDNPETPVEKYMEHYKTLTKQ